MAPKLPEPLEHVLRPLFNALPVDQAMSKLVVEGDPGSEHVQLVEQILQDPALDGRPELAAGLWLYIDQLDRSHAISQTIETPTGSFWHAMMHRREGDFANSHYWYRKAANHPAMNRIDVAGGGAGAGTTVADYEAHEFVDRVDRAHAKGKAYGELISLQRREWVALFEWCAER